MHNFTCKNRAKSVTVNDLSGLHDLTQRGASSVVKFSDDVSMSCVPLPFRRPIAMGNLPTRQADELSARRAPEYFGCIQGASA